MPDAPKASNQRADVQRKSRIEAMGERAAEITYPPCTAFYIARYLFEVGPVCSGAAGPAPLTFTEIAAWQEVMGLDLSPWELGMLRKLSIVYISMSEQAKHPSCPQPWLPDVRRSPEEAEKVANRVRNALRG